MKRKRRKDKLEAYTNTVDSVKEKWSEAKDEFKKIDFKNLKFEKNPKESYFLIFLTAVIGIVLTILITVSTIKGF